MKKKLSLTQSLVWILFSAIVVNAMAFSGIQGWKYWKKKRGENNNVPFKAIVQTGLQKEALPSNYLAELLSLSCDKPTLSKSFDLKKAKKKLLTSPVIKEVEVKITEPGILYIDYTIRQPLAFLMDFKNVALDQEKVPFPIAPFYTPKKLPQVYLGWEEEIQWNCPIKGEKIDLAYRLLEILCSPIVDELFHVEVIDVSKAFEKSLGSREIVLTITDELYVIEEGREVRITLPRLLRLSAKKYAQELANYLKLREELLEKEKSKLSELNEDFCCPVKIIDFRIPELAFIQE